MTFCRGLTAAAGCAGLLGSELRADERTRHFAAAKCQYPLPADGWSWADRLEHENAVFAVNGPGGIVVVLSYLEAPQSARVDQKFADGLDRRLIIPGKLEKR